jgi:hypothetical protein
VIHGGNEKESQNAKDQSVFDDVLTGLIAEEVGAMGRVHAISFSNRPVVHQEKGSENLHRDMWP